MQISILGSLRPNAGPATVSSFVADVARAHDEGFARMWVPQLPFDPDLLTVMAVAAREVADIELATGVLPIQVQHPMHLAQRALTVNMLLEGRLVLGLGLSHKVVSEGSWGISFDRPVRRMKEFLDGLLPLLQGRAVDAPGDLLTSVGALQIPDVAAPPVYLAALGPQMLRLAGRRTDGTLTWMTGPKTLRDLTGPTLREAGAEEGRSPKVAAALPVAVTDDVDAARAAAAEQFAMYGHLPSYRAMLDREGLAEPADAALIGDEDTVTAQLAELRDAGADEFVGIDFFPDDEVRARTRALMRARDGA